MAASKVSKNAREGARVNTRLTLAVGMPTYGGRRNTIAVINQIRHPEPFARVIHFERSSSLLAYCFNQLWIDALNLRDKGEITHFMMLHDDIRPLVPTWLGDFYKLMKAADAKVISLVSPIKDTRGLTSTALDTENPWAPRRLTMAEIAKQPAVFTAPNLLVNTGCLLIDFRDPWVEKIRFTIQDDIQMVDGKRYACVQPEDWDFSRQCRALGVPLYATAAVPVVHLGSFSYPNFGVWGTAEQDPGDAQ